MPKGSKQPKKSCVTYEVTQRDSKGEHAITPFSDSLASSGVLAKQAITKMKMVQELGWPAAKNALKDNQGRKLIVKKDDLIWLLKCKPSCWRLYFYVYESDTQKWLIYVNAICKKQDEEDETDAHHARSLADDIRSRGSAVRLFPFPAG